MQVENLVDARHEIVVAISKDKIFSLGTPQTLIAGPSGSTCIYVFDDDDFHVVALGDRLQQTLKQFRRSTVGYDEGVGQISELTN